MGYIHRLQLENERLKVFNWKLHKEANKAQKAIESRIWLSAIVIAVAIVAFGYLVGDINAECFQNIGI